MQKLSHAQLAALVKRVQQGDIEAFSSIYAATVESQLYFATSFLKDASLAEDVVQEVYLSLYKSLNRLKNPKLFVAYLNRICYNVCVDYKRSLQNRQAELDEDALAKLLDASPDWSPDDRYAILEQQSELQSALAGLPDTLRATFLLRYYNEMKIHEIAAVMNCSESTVKRNIRAATAKLKHALDAMTDYAPTKKKDSNYV